MGEERQKGKGNADAKFQRIWLGDTFVVTWVPHLATKLVRLLVLAAIRQQLLIKLSLSTVQMLFPVILDLVLIVHPDTLYIDTVKLRKYKVAR